MPYIDQDALQHVEHAIQRVEAAVNGKWSTPQWIAAAFIGYFFWTLPGQILHSKWRYATENNVSTEKVMVDNLPHDCAFFAAPVGNKYCHYEREVTTRRWATSTSGDPIVSYDEGKSWSVFTPDAGITVPREPTVEEVYITWKKVED